MIYIKKRETFYAVDLLNRYVYEVRNIPANRTINKQKATPMLLELIKRDAQSITEAEFQEQFSGVVEYFHNETPFVQ
jgi:hypothetical protein